MRNKSSFVGEGGHENYVHAFKFQAQHGAELQEQPQSYGLYTGTVFHWEYAMS